MDLSNTLQERKDEINRKAEFVKNDARFNCANRNGLIYIKKYITQTTSGNAPIACNNVT